MKAIGNLFLNNKIRAYNGDIVRSSYVGYAKNSITDSGSLVLTSINLGATPTAALLFGGKITSGANLISIGAYSSSAQNSVQFRSENGTVLANSSSTVDATNAYHAMDNATITIRSTVNVTSATGGGINSTFTTSEAIPNEIRALLLAATNVDVTTKVFSNNEVYTKTGLSFTPNLIIAIGQQNFIISIGFGTSASQCSVTRLDQTSLNPASIKTHISSSLLIRNTDFANRDVTLNSINVDGYTMTRGSASTTTTLCIMALEIVGTPVIGIYDTPATTGNHLLNLGHFTIDHFIVSTGIETVNSTVTTTDASGMSISAFNGETQYSYGIISRDGVSPTQTESYYSDSAIHLRNSVGSDLLKATVAELTENGPILNWTNVGAAAKKMIVLGIYY